MRVHAPASPPPARGDTDSGMWQEIVSQVCRGCNGYSALEMSVAMAMAGTGAEMRIALGHINDRRVVQPLLQLASGAASHYF